MRTRYVRCTDRGPIRRIGPHLVAATALILICGPAARAVTPVLLAHYGTTTYEFQDPNGVVHALSSRSADLRPPFTHAFPKAPSGGGTATLTAGPGPESRLSWTDMSLDGPAASDAAMILRSEGAAAYFVYESDEKTTLPAGLWVGIRGRLDQPAGTAGPGSLSLRLNGTMDVGAWDDGNWGDYVYDLPSVDIRCDFQDGPGSATTANDVAIFRFLNTERTEFEAFGLSRLDPPDINGLGGFAVYSDLEVIAGPGVHVELTNLPYDMDLPVFGAYAVRPGPPGVIPEPSTLSLLALGALGALRARRR